MIKLKIGFDAKRAFNNHSGLGVYSRELISNFSELYPDYEYLLFTPKKTIDYSPQLKIESSKFKSIWRSFLIYFDIKRLRINLYHGLAGELPFWFPKSAKSVVTIHDLLFERYPQDYTMIDRSIYRFKAKRACIIANKIIAVSECTKQDLIDFYQIDPSKITVLPVSINVNLKKFDSQIHSKEFVVCISSYLKRKNQALLVDAFCLIADQVNFDLILIGKGSELNYIQKLAKESGYSDRIIFKTELKDDEKFQYLSQAKFSVYPSKFEGFGIPIIESLSYQTPILVSDTEIHREVGGDAVFYFKNNDIQDLKDKFIYMNELSESEKNDKSQKGLQKINSYRSEALMPRLKSIYDEVLNPI